MMRTAISPRFAMRIFVKRHNCTRWADTWVRPYMRSVGGHVGPPLHASGPDRAEADPTTLVGADPCVGPLSQRRRGGGRPPMVGRLFVGVGELEEGRFAPGPAE